MRRPPNRNLRGRSVVELKANLEDACTFAEQLEIVEVLNEKRRALIARLRRASRRGPGEEGR